MNSEKSFSNLYLFVPLLVAAPLYILGLTGTDLWTPDEPRYALVAREMIERGDYVQPYCNGEPYTEKPPLFFWTVAAAAKLLGGVDQLAVRLPSVLSALGTLALLIAFVNELFGKKAAFLSGIFLGTSPQFFWLARSGHIDMLLAFLMTAALVSFYRWYARGGKSMLAIFYGCLALGTLAKGPLGIVLPLAIALCFLLVRKEWRRIRQMRLWLGLPIAVGLVLAWYIPAARRSPGYGMAPVFGRQIINRVLYAENHGVSLLYWPFFQVTAFAWGMAPWSLLIPFAAVAAYRGRRDSRQFFLICWAGMIFAFFTLIATKRETYILPMYPAAAALAAGWCARAIRSARFRPLRVAVAGYGVVLLLIAAGSLVVAPGYIAREYPGAPLDFSRALIVLWAVAAIAAIAGALLGRKAWHLIGAYSAAASVAFAIVIAALLPWVNKAKSPRGICGVYNSARASDSELGMFARVREEYVFYARSLIRSITSTEDLKQMFASDKRMFCFVELKHYDAYVADCDFPAYVLAKQRVSSRIMLLLCNQQLASSLQTVSVRRRPAGPRLNEQPP